jgi:hypothetical protein
MGMSRGNIPGSSPEGVERRGPPTDEDDRAEGLKAVQAWALNRSATIPRNIFMVV